MGISFSTNRRRNNSPATFYHHHHPPPEYYPPYPAHPPLPPHAFPAPPPPVYYPHYQSYNVSNYTSNFVGGPPNYGPIHTGFPASSQVVAPPPYVEDQQAKKVRSDVNVHKDTLILEVDQINPEHHLVSFLFDAMFDGSITIWYFAKEDPNGRLVSSFPEVYEPIKVPFRKGLCQQFSQPSGTGIDLGFFVSDDLSNPKDDVFPLVIVAETCPPSYTEDYGNDHLLCQLPHMQITQAVLERNNEGSFSVKTIKQILWVDDVRYELRELYGIGSLSLSQGNNDSDSGSNCVICMTEPKDTAILPCRHLCLCSDCSKTLRLQSNRCPICRELIEELLEIKINNINVQ